VNVVQLIMSALLNSYKPLYATHERIDTVLQLQLPSNCTHQNFAFLYCSLVVMHKTLLCRRKHYMVPDSVAAPAKMATPTTNYHQTSCYLLLA